MASREGQKPDVYSNGAWRDSSGMRILFPKDNALGKDIISGSDFARTGAEEADGLPRTWKEVLSWVQTKMHLPVTAWKVSV